MSTPVINAIDNVNQSALETLFGAIAADPTARDNLSQSNRNIDKVSTNAGVIKALDANEDAILRLLCRREGRDPSNFNTLDDVADDVPLVRDLSVRQTTTGIIQSSAKASSALSANDRATREMMCFPAGLDATTFTDVADVASDGTAMNTISTNAQAMRSTAVLPLAMQEVAASQTAMQEVAASQAAMSAIGDNLSIAENTVLNSSVSTSELSNSPLEETIEDNYGNRSNAGGTLTDDKVLVTSNNNSGAGTGISFTTVAGPETQNDTTFVITEANYTNNAGVTGGGSVSINGIRL